jgi:diamine N-acetyltransferase
MSDDTLININSKVSLREITRETVRTICRLSDTLLPEQQRMVAPNAVSIAEAYFNEHAWFRAIYADETPVGFIMLYIGPDDDNPQEIVYFLWRFMIAGPYQKMGFGRIALQTVIDDLKDRGVTRLGTSCGEGEASPFNFYLKLGFEPTGKMYGDEIGLELKIA